MKYILASKSPRRKELLSRLVKDFDIIDSNIEEKMPKSLSFLQVPVYIAKQKAKAVAKNHPNDIVIAADTVVITKNEILGKPKNKEDAKRMIELLSGKTHIVVSGVCIIKNGKMTSFNSKTYVTFVKMSEEEINEYCNLTTIYDKAGAYAIQEEAGKYISSIKGDYYNVVGLPLSKLNKKLSEL